MPKIYKNNNKKKTKQKQTRKTKGPLPPSTYFPSRNISVYADPKATPSNVVALINPFSDKARGMKWPDGNGTSTCTFQLRTLYTLTTFANGTGLNYFGADPLFGALGATTNAFALNTIWSATASTTFTSFANQMRTVSAGIIIRCIVAPLTTQGVVVVTRQGVNAPLGSTVTPGAIQGSDVDIYPLVAGLEIPIVFRTLGTSAREMKNFSTSSSLVTGALWDVIKVELVGCAASVASVLSIEHVVNAEFTLPEVSEGIAQIMPANAPFSRALCDLSDKLSGPLVHSSHRTLSAFTTYALKLAATGVASYFGGPGAGSAVRMLTNSASAMEID